MASQAASSTPAKDATVARRAGLSGRSTRARQARGILRNAQRERLQHQHVELRLGGKDRPHLVDGADGEGGHTEARGLGGQPEGAGTVAVALGYGDEEAPAAVTASRTRS